MIHPTSSSIENSVVMFKRERKRNNSDDEETKEEKGYSIIEYFIIGLSFLLLICLFPFSLIVSLKVIIKRFKMNR